MAEIRIRQRASFARGADAPDGLAQGMAGRRHPSRITGQLSTGKFAVQDTLAHQKWSSFFDLGPSWRLVPDL